ncbi:MAG: addiction module antidote protein [Bdellovibrionota bacterium]
MAKKNKSRDRHEHLIEVLKKPDEAVEYLKAALEEGDMPELFLLALRNVADAQGIKHISEMTGLNRENLYKILSKKGNPTLGSLYAILNAVGVKLSIEPKSDDKKAS